MSCSTQLLKAQKMHHQNLKPFIITLFCLALAACGPDVKTLDIKTSTTKITVSEPPAPRELVVSPVNVNVITKENFSDLESQLKLDPKSVFLILTPADYENLASNIADMRRYITQQSAIVQYYRETVKTLTNTPTDAK
jgi:hypothetical protein